ncbi:MAG: sulfatase-like hydrolase/transferase [Cyanobacteriota bacterium]|nr:sulfatase-like hydrolase/transferase [Cyanobacteriota bacterium]
MQQPNILMVVLDTQRADRLSCYNPSHRDPERPPTTPCLDRFAEESTLFERAISPAQWTIPAHASMFTGEYPSTHQTVQADIELGREFPTLAEILKLGGYHTVGFCNNPLVGVLKNGLRRGFEAFYNYGGALPTRPAAATPLPPPLNFLLEQYTQFWRKLSYPLQNAFAKSDRLFQLALHPWLVPLWTKAISFKGNTAESLRDVSRFLRQAALDQSRPQEQNKPFFCFVNLMEPHLPYWPPEPFIQKFAPYFLQDRAARDFLRQYNHQPYRWMAPLPEPLTPLQSQVLSDIYDAEVAYQDHLLGSLFETLHNTGLDSNTLVVVVADHGEGLGEHQFVGHAFVVYEELVRVPLIIRYPQQFPAGARIATPVSTRRLFHTLLEVAGIPFATAQASSQALLNRQQRREISRLSLSRTLVGEDPEQATVLSEGFPPHILIRAMEKRADQQLQRFACHTIRRALYQGSQKLVQVGSTPSLYHLEADPSESQDLLQADPQSAAHLQSLLQTQVAAAEARRPHRLTDPTPIDLTSDANLVKQMQELGYLE